jgi:hypothetical protein
MRDTAGLQAPQGAALSRRGFLKTGAVGGVSVLMGAAVEAAPQGPAPQIPRNNTGQYQPPVAPEPQITQRFENVRLGALLLGETHVTLQGVTITKKPAPMPGFQVVGNKDHAFAIIPQKFGVAVVDFGMLAFGAPGAFGSFGSIRPDFPAEKMPQALEFRRRGKAMDGQAFPLMAQFAQAMRCFMERFPEETECRIVTARLLKGAEGSKILVSIPFKLPEAPDTIETLLTRIVLGHQRDQLKFAQTGIKSLDYGGNEIRAAMRHPDFSACSRLALGLNVKITGETIDQVRERSTLTMEGVLNGNVGNGARNQPFVPRFAIVKTDGPSQLERLAGTPNRVLK